MVVTTRETLGSRIARLRGKASQEAFAERSGTSRRTLQNIENGETESPGIDIVQKIASALNVSIDYLINGSEQEKDPLPEWAGHIKDQLSAIEKQISANRPISPVPPELWAAWGNAKDEKWRQQIAMFFLTGQPTYLDKDVPEELRRRLDDGLRFHKMKPAPPKPPPKR